MAISPQTPDSSLSTAEMADLAFPVLSDVGNVVADAFGLVFGLAAGAQDLHRELGVDLAAVNGDESWQLPAAATFIVDPQGTIAYASVSGDYRWRVGPDEVLAALRTSSA